MKCPAKTLIAIAVAAAVVPGAAQAAKVSAKLSGQISYLIGFADNGVNDDVLIADNNNSGTRTKITGSTDLGNGLKAGVIWETDWQFNDSANMDIGDGDLDKDQENRLRDLWFSGPFGKVSLGRGNGAANGTSETDFSGTWIASNSGDFHLGGLQFRTPGNAEVSNYGGVFSNFDGLSRNVRLRYDTPALGPVVLSGDVGQEKFELAARVNQKLAGGGKFGAAIGYVDTEGVGVGSFDGDQIGLSASMLMGNGFNITGHWGQRSPDGAAEDPSGWYLKIGQKLASGSLTAAYHQTDDVKKVNDEGKKYGIEYVHNLKDHGVELYGGLWKAELDRPGTAVEDLSGVFVGSRVKF